MLSHLYISREGDREIITEYVEEWRDKSHAELIASYNRSQKKGFFGVHRQGLYILSMHFAFLKRYSKSPIKVTENVLIDFTFPIVQVGDSWEYAAIQS